MDATRWSQRLKETEDAYLEKLLTHSCCNQFFLVVSQQSCGKPFLDRQPHHYPQLIKSKKHQLAGQKKNCSLFQLATGTSGTGRVY